MINSFLGTKDLVEILVRNKKAYALFSSSMIRLIRILGPISFTLFGYPFSIYSRTCLHDLFKLMSPITGSLIDIGCSFGGAHTFELARRMAPHQVVGLDIDPVSINVASRLNEVLHFDNLSFKVGDILEDIDIRNQFDIAVSIETLEHVREDQAAIRRIADLLKPNGWLVISVPYCEYPIEYENPEKAFTSLTEETSIFFKGGYHWRSGYNEERLKSIIDPAGFDIIALTRTRTISFLPDKPYLFPIMYPLSRFVSKTWGTTSNINLLAQKRY